MSLTCGNTFAMAPSTTQVTHNTLITISSTLDARLARVLPSSLQGLSELRTTSANLSLCLRTVRNFTRSPVFQTFLSSNVFCPRLTLAAAIVQRVCITSYVQRVPQNTYQQFRPSRPSEPRRLHHSYRTPGPSRRRHRTSQSQNLSHWQNINPPRAMRSSLPVRAFLVAHPNNSSHVSHIRRVHRLRVSLSRPALTHAELMSRNLASGATTGTRPN